MSGGRPIQPGYRAVPASLRPLPGQARHLSGRRARVGQALAGGKGAAGGTYARGAHLPPNSRAGAAQRLARAAAAVVVHDHAFVYIAPVASCCI